MFTRAQQPRYRNALQKAWLVHCERTGTNLEFDGLFEEWKREQLREAIGIDSTKGANHTDDFDRLMLHLAIIADDTEAISYFSAATERRIRFLIGDHLKYLSRLEHRILGWDYVRGIAKHMQLPLSLEECPGDMLFKAFQALDKHVRRIRAARDELVVRSDNATPGMGDVRREKEHQQELFGREESA